MFANKIRSRMSKPIFLTFILTLIISCATHTPNPSSWLDKRSTPVTQDSICRLISYCQTQANIEIQHGNYAEALYWKDETLRLKDTLLSVRNLSRFLALEFAYIRQPKNIFMKIVPEVFSII